MISTMRKKFGPIIVGIIVGGIAFVFIFEFGMNRRMPGETGGGAFAGTVNGEPISLTDFNRHLNQQMEFYKSMGAGNLTDEMIKAYHIKDRVFEDIANRKLMIQEAEHQGLLPSDEEIRQQIMEIEAFKRDGQFDRQLYKQKLEDAGYMAGVFEKQVRDDLIVQQWGDYFKNLVRFSEEELKHEYLMTADKRKIRYVLLSLDAGKKNLNISEKEVEDFLANPSKRTLVQQRFDAGKAFQYKGKTFDQTKNDIARDYLSEGKTSEIRKANEALGAQVAKALTGDAKSDAKVNGLLKSLGLKVQNSALMARGSFYVPGAGDARDVEADAFSGKLDAPKSYSLAGGTLVAITSGKEVADLARFNEEERENLINKIISRKENQLYSQWIHQLHAKAKITKSTLISEEPIKDES